MFLVSLSKLHAWHHRSLKNTSNHTNHWETQHVILNTESTLVPQIDKSHTIISSLQISFCNIWNIRNSSYKMRGEFQPVASGSPLWNASSVSIVSDYRLEDRGSIPGRDKGLFPVVSLSRPALRAIQWVPGTLFPGVKRGRGVTLTTHSHLVSRSRMRSFLSPLASAWRVKGQLLYHKGTASISSVYETKYEKARTQEEFRHKCGLKCVQKWLESTRRHFVICTPTPLVTTSSKYSRISILCSSTVFTKSGDGSQLKYLLSSDIQLRQNLSLLNVIWR
jgi:hypothetical protein